MSNREQFMQMAIDLAYRNVESGGKPFGAVIVKNGEVIATGVNEVLDTYDPTRHAELAAISEACRKLQSSDLSGCELYASGEPCPMCLTASYMANLKKIYYAYNAEEEEEAGLGTKYYYEQVSLPHAERDMKMNNMEKNTAVNNPFELWVSKQKA
ncbi:nucleoside deaminase [Chungangia koreensis]|uniref:Nucleoside deaminase n=1 Tax=Chungangia koreensis TaxID=752657 RepID=A0ABV8X8C4_9LACT